MPLRVLITGASIAGTACAWWLVRHGVEVTVVERAPEFRTGGQNVDVRGAARTVLQRMGLEDAVASLGTRERGVAFVDETGRVVAEFEQQDVGDRSLTAELEILRGDLAQLLYDACRDRAEHRFGDAIASLAEREGGVDVEFEHGTRARFDLVVVAEGVGSSTRELAFAGDDDPRWLDVDMGYFSIPRGPADGDLALWYNAPGGRSVFLRPDREGTTTRVVLTVQKPPSGEHELAPAQQKAYLRRSFADAGWEIDRVLRGLDTTDDFYFDALRQVRMDHWSRGRVVLTGDAAWCVTPLVGAGTSLALVAGYVLAGELAGTPDVAAALAQYERVMRPFVDEVQSVPKFGPRIAQPQSRLGIALQRTLLGIVSTTAVKQVIEPLLGSTTGDVALPDYPLVADTRSS